jgi:hypothetical protein
MIRTMEGVGCNTADNKHISFAVEVDATIAELLESFCCMRSMLKLHIQDEWDLLVSYKMIATQWGHELGGRGVSTVPLWRTAGLAVCCSVWISKGYVIVCCYDLQQFNGPSHCWKSVYSFWLITLSSCCLYIIHSRGLSLSGLPTKTFYTLSYFAMFAMYELG